MNLIRNLSIRNKLLLFSLIPLATLFYFLTENISNKIASKNRIEQVYDDVLKAEAISNVLHQIQQERAYSIAYLLRAGKEEKGDLFSQREQTDKAIFNLNVLLQKQEENKEGQKLLDNIPLLRGEINSFKASPDSIRNVYGEINGSLIDEVNKTVIFSKNPEVKNLLNAHMFMLFGKEFYSQLRATLKQAILSNGFKGDGFAEFSSLKGKYEINLQNFRKNASDELVDYYNKKMENPSIHLVRGIIDTAYHHPAVTQFPLSNDDWKINSLSFLNTLKEIEDYSSLSIRQTAENELAEISGSLIRSILIAFAIVLLLAILLYYTIKYIVSSLLRIKDAADRIVRGGKVDLSLSINSKDEIGDLADSFNKLIQVSKEYAQAADVIGGGDYSPVVRVRSDADMLGISLNNMKDNLQKLSKENELRTWLLTGNSELNDQMRGEKEVHALAQEVVNKLTIYLKAQIGAIYLAENGHLSLVGSYAFHYRKENNNVFKLGEGLVGQAALEKKPIIFSQVPDDYVKINSGLGNSPPKNIVVYPFQYDGQLKGVIEIGSVTEFSKHDLQFLSMVAENIGIAFNSSESRTKMKELLEETQRQAEELEAQQEELRQINEELHEKAELLVESEAELKAQQEELQQTNEEIEEHANLLEEQKDRLEVAKMEVETKARELEITSKYKSEFLANMSHELRTPLNSILILAQLLAENKSKVLGEKEVKFAQNIYSSGTDLLNLINEILDLSKVESGNIELEISEVNLDEITESLQTTFKEVAINKSNDFEINYRKENFKNPFITDKLRLEQILRNLLSNAFKFTGKGGKVSLDIAIIQTNDNLRNRKLHQMDEVVAFSVTDTGIGIPESKQDVIFEAFQQADGSTKRKYGGTGLGLSISRELANALGGEIHLKSEEGIGSTFTLYLPLKFDASIVIPAEKQVSVKKTPEKVLTQQATENTIIQENVSDDRFVIQENDKVILIIEDDIQFANILLQFIRDKGYKGILAHQGNTGLSLARYHRPDAIILDMGLPVMDGTEVLKHLKNDPDLRHIPVQVISGYDRRNEGFEFGAFDFIRKPITQDELTMAFGRIEEFISRKLKKLLIVEDNKQQNLAIRELIGNGDVKSFSAYTGEDAHKMMQKEKFDCIIIDLGLPDMSGMDLLEKIKANGTLNKIPIIVYTGKELSKQEATQLNKLANTVVLKTADSKERLLDETILFLHSMESRLPKEKQQIIRKLHRTDEVLQNKKVLLVDDDMRNIYSLTNALEEEGVRCITAENGKEAIQTLKEQPDTDIILMDVMMPEMDGYEATQEIRKVNKFAKLPIIALTAKAMKGDREKCLEAGMSDYIAKPVNMEKLLSLMRVWLYH